MIIFHLDSHLSSLIFFLLLVSVRISCGWYHHHVSCHCSFASSRLTRGSRPALLLIMADLIHTTAYFLPHSFSVLGTSAIKPKKPLSHPPTCVRNSPPGGYDSTAASSQFVSKHEAEQEKGKWETKRPSLTPPFFVGKSLSVFVCLAKLDERLALWDVGV